jgi:hypothetical protein
MYIMRCQMPVRSFLPHSGMTANNDNLTAMTVAPN